MGAQVDASGSLEAVRAALNQLPQDSISLRFLHAAAGPVTGADIDLAAAAEGSLVIAFNTSISEAVMSNAKNAGVLRPESKRGSLLGAAGLVCCSI